MWTIHQDYITQVFLDIPRLLQLITIRDKTYFINNGNIKYGKLLYIPPLLKTDKLWFYYPPSTDTSLAAYINRHKPFVSPTYDKKQNKKLYKFIKKFEHRPDPWTFEQYIDSMSSSSKRKQYTDHFEDWQRTRKIPSYIQPFTKIEKMNDSKYKAPRMIQGRHMIFNLHYGRYIKPLEKHVTKYGKLSNHFGKGDYNTIARKIEKLSKRYTWYTECDHTNFDAHVTKEQLEMTHIFYRNCYPNHKSELAQLSKRTINNVCISRTGDKYRTKASRMSGDVDTGFGNCLINYAILKAALHELKIKGEVIVNGDDSIIFSEAPIDQNKFTEIMLKYNMETKCQESQQNIHKTEFCRTKMVYNSKGQPTMQIDPNRLTDIYGMTYTVSEKKYHKYLEEVAMCNAFINSNNYLGIMWAKYFNIDIKEYKKNEKKKQKMLENITMLERDKILKMLSLAVEEVDEAEITPSMLQAWPKIVDIESKIRKLADMVKNKKYVYKQGQTNLIINHDHQTIQRY